jgi:AraC-like DNA-binding protein
LPRWLKLLEILHVLSVSDELGFASKNHVVGINGIETDRMNRVFEFVFRNYQREITIKEVADIANLANNSFSRFFSQRTRKSFIEFVNEVRLSHACKLLQENKLSVSDICYASGYNNLSNFNRQFKKLYKVSPLKYARQFTLSI